MRSSLLVSSAVLALTATGALGATIVNGDMTGPVGISLVPPGWFVWQGTPDTCDASGPFNNTPTPWTLSPNGGTFVRSAGGPSTSPGSEAIGQNVTGFTPGLNYTITFHLTNLGFQHPTSGIWSGEDGYWDFYINGAPVGTSIILSKQTDPADPIVWFNDSIDFIAPTADFEIAFIARSSSAAPLAAYMGIDGVTVIPAPGAPMLAFMCGVAATRRRRTA